MSIFEIIGGIMLLISSVFIVVITLLQENKQQGMTSAIGGGSDSFYGRNKSRTREAQLARITRVMIIIFFVVTIAVNLVPAFLK